MHLLSSNALYHLLWLVPLALGLGWLGASTRRRRLARLIPDATQRDLLSANASPARRAWRLVLLVLGLAWIGLALARPTWGTKRVDTPMPTRDILVLIDTSRSMLARDVAPTRLQHARFIVNRLVERLPGDRFGIVAFAGAAALVCPLTSNHGSVQLYLEEIDTKTVSVGGTNIPAALRDATRAFEAAADRHCAILLITDGDNLGGDPSAEVAALKKQGVKIFTVGLGDSQYGSLIQLSDNTFVTNAAGERVNTKLNEAMLQNLAADTGGEYVHSTAVNDGVDFLQRCLVDLIPNTDASTTQRTVPNERFQIPLVIGLLCLLLRACIGERRRQSTAPARPPVPGSVAAALVVACLLGITLAAPSSFAAGLTPPVPAPGAAAEAEPPDPHAAEKAALAQREVTVHNLPPGAERARQLFNLGRQYQDLDAVADARRLYEQVVGTANATAATQAAAYQNLGAMRHADALKRLGEQQADGALESLKDAQSWYREAMRRAPNSADLTRNQELLMHHRELAERLKQLQQQQQQQQQQAQDKAQKALDAQQQANEQRQQSQQASSPEEQQKGAEQAQRQQNDANQKTGDARDAVDQLQQTQQQLAKAKQEAKDAAPPKSADDKGKAQPDPAQAKNDGKSGDSDDAKQAKAEAQAQAAADQLDKAQDAQKQAGRSLNPAQQQQNAKQAEDRLKDAVAKLAQEPPKQDSKDDQQSQEGKNGDEAAKSGMPKDSGSGQPKDPQSADVNKPPPKGQQGEAKDGKESDPNAELANARPSQEDLNKAQAERLLNQMQGTEKDFMQELRNGQRARQSATAQDW